MKTVTFDPAITKVNFNGYVCDCKYVEFIGFDVSKNDNGTLTVMPVFQNPITGEICNTFDTYPEFIRYILEAQTLNIRYNSRIGEAMLWYETIQQDCGLTAGDIISCIHVEGEIFDHLRICTNEMFNAHIIEEAM